MVKRLHTAYTKRVFPLLSITNRSLLFFMYAVVLDRIRQILEFFIIGENKIETCGKIRIKWGNTVLF